MRISCLATLVTLGCFKHQKIRLISSKIMSLTRKAEIPYHAKGGSYILGVDEAGRGPLAGPVVTAACFIENDIHIDGINDSKQTKEEEREAMYNILTKHPKVHWAATVVSHLEIDEVNILQATMNGMRRSTTELYEKLIKKFPKGHFKALVDGNRVPTDMPIDSNYVIKGDSIIFSIAAASIIAKVTRDRLMLELDKEFPIYNFAQHKGYPTFAHRTILMTHGPCRVHRVSYGPVKLAMVAHGIPLPESASSKEKDTKEVTSSKKRTTSISKKNVSMKSKSKIEEVILSTFDKKVELKPKKKTTGKIIAETITVAAVVGTRRSSRLAAIDSLVSLPEPIVDEGNIISHTKISLKKKVTLLPVQDSIDSTTGNYTNSLNDKKRKKNVAEDDAKSIKDMKQTRKSSRVTK